MDTCLEVTEENTAFVEFQSSVASENVMRFSFLRIRRGGNEMGISLENISTKVGFDIPTLSI